MNTEEIKERFNSAAEDYDSRRRILIPCFDDYYETMTGFLSGIIPEPESILDLGAGTGLLSKFWFNYFKNSKYTLVDVADQMMEVAKKRFHELTNFNYIIADYSKDFPKGNYDLISSALSIHHLSDDEKLNLYKKIFKALPSKGYFVNFDQFNGNTELMTDLYNNWWYEHIKDSGITGYEKNTWAERRKADKENSVEESIEMLNEAGFQIVECIYRYMKFGVIFAIKSGI
ncbi:MAG: methyltransferase domain-containing protein [Spirochaetota bacterium]